MHINKVIWIISTRITFILRVSYRVYTSKQKQKKNTSKFHENYDLCGSTYTNSMTDVSIQTL